jgi:hypothetical protein
MPVVARPFPAVLPHGDLTEILPGLHFVTGTVAMPGPLSPHVSRNMTVVREGERLVLVNSVRLDDRGLAALDALGKVTDVLRIAAAHGMDDPFYKDRYGAKVWAVKGQRYTPGFAASAPAYFEPDVEMEPTTKLPLEGARLQVIHSLRPEGLLLLDRDDGVLVSGDCLQNWAAVDAYSSFFTGVMMRVMGFIKPYNVGPAWLKNGKPPIEEMRAILGLPFTKVIPAHGSPALVDARERYRPAIERLRPPDA